MPCPHGCENADFCPGCVVNCIEGDARAEVERLRAALEEIRKWCRGPKELPADLLWLTTFVEHVLTPASDEPQTRPSSPSP